MMQLTIIGETIVQTGTALDDISRSEPLTIAASVFIIVATYILF